MIVTKGSISRDIAENKWPFFREQGYEKAEEPVSVFSHEPVISEASDPEPETDPNREDGDFSEEVNPDELSDNIEAEKKVEEPMPTLAPKTEEQPAAEAPEPETLSPVLAALNKMTLPQLRSYAEKKGIDISGITAKSNILAKIKTAESGT